jgi:transcriptional regulator with XRE-family HTH domain
MPAAAVPPDTQQDNIEQDNTEQDRPAGEADIYVTGSNAPVITQRTLEQSIGSQVRSYRTRLGLKAADLAAAAGISGSLMSKIETGQVSASLSTLQAVAQALNAPLAAFFTTSEERRDCSFVRAGQGVVIERRGTKAGHLYRLLGPSLAGDLAVEPYLITLSEEAVPYTAFQHAGTELIYMISGRVAYRHADKTYELGPGDTLMFDATAVHGPETLIELPMTYLSIIVYGRAD